MTRLRQLRLAENLRSGIQAAESNPVGAAEPDNRLRCPRLFLAGRTGVGLDLEIDRQIDCKCVPPSPLVAKRILTAPSLRTTIDIVQHYAARFCPACKILQFHSQNCRLKRIQAEISSDKAVVILRLGTMNTDHSSPSLPADHHL